MSTKIKERLKKLMLELTHEERVILDKALEQRYIARYGYIAHKENEKACDKIVEEIPDEIFREIVNRIKKKKKRVEVAAE